ncbi:hypothetical protein [Limosilactobacillus reuteri]|uniref:hypothetical protein n=1 Tax=Limosilactobacillus reuteri TaxID=1598 RepID=UPI001E4E9231|nr:hypothetical protein [Limosilactobacillus reuteri]UFK69120.1 hypothetical protein IVR12_02231 [Limosilactobacillus reuteri]
MNKQTVTNLSKLPNIWTKHTIKPKAFSEFDLHSDNRGFLNPKFEGIDSGTLGTAIDLGARYLILNDDCAFDNAKIGAFNYDLNSNINQAYLKQWYIEIGDTKTANELSKPLDNAAFHFNLNKSVLENARKIPLKNLERFQCEPLITMAFFESCFRSRQALDYDIPFRLDRMSFSRIRTMLQRCANFFRKYGAPTHTDYTVTANNVFGDGDYLSENYVADFKTYKRSPLDKPYNRRQILLYYAIGKYEQKYPEFQTIRQLIFFNPRTDKVYSINVDDISPDLINYYIEIANNPILDEMKNQQTYS